MATVKNNNKRPVFLNLLRVRLPVAGLVSILHRITGVLLALLLPGLFYLLQLSLESEAGFRRVQELLAPAPARLLLLALIGLLAQHFFSGIRHLLLDLDLGVSRRAGGRSAWLALAASLAFTLWAGVALW